MSFLIAVCLHLAMNHFAGAALVIPTSYSMVNGNGIASDGMLNYWDRFYSGTGSSTTDNAPLSGGLGDLTDGILAAGNWFSVENVAGEGPYVGWVNLNPTITFHFASLADINTVRIHLDDADGAGGVSVPASVLINGFTFPLTDPVGSEPFFAEFDIAHLPPATALTIQLNASNDWVFASEFEFSTIASTPEPSSFVLMGLGLIAMTTFGRQSLGRAKSSSSP
jgi:hypothetical protein